MKTATVKTSKPFRLAKRLVPLTVFTVALGSCCAWATDVVPFNGGADGAIVSTSPDPAGVSLRVLATGNATHFGRFSREEVLLLDPTRGIITGTVVFTAANGDQLSGTVAGQFTSPTT